MCNNDNENISEYDKYYKDTPINLLAWIDELFQIKPMDDCPDESLNDKDKQ